MIRQGTKYLGFAACTLFLLTAPVLSEATSGSELDASSERVLLTPEQLDQEFAALDEWTLSDDRTVISKTFEFDDFVQAFGFMSSVALVAEKLDHHPDWSNIYKTVEISLNSYTLGGVTNKDIELAKRIDAIAAVP